MPLAPASTKNHHRAGIPANGGQSAVLTLAQQAHNGMASDSVRRSSVEQPSSAVHHTHTDNDESWTAIRWENEAAERSSLNYIKDEVLSKLSHDGQWITRRLALTKEVLLFLRLEDQHIVDSIPLHEVEKVQRRKQTDPQGFSRTFSSHSSQMGTPHRESSSKALELGSSVSSDDFSVLPDNYAFVFDIRTAKDGFNSGRTYTLAVGSEESCESWAAEIKNQAKTARKSNQAMNRIQKWQKVAQSIHDSMAFQLSVVGLIICNFVVVVLQAELKPEEGTDTDKLLFRFDIAFTTTFLCELLLNFFAHFFWPFWMDGWNWFDFLVVSVSLVQLVLRDLPGLSHLRILRTFRLLRIFGRMAQLRRIVNCITASILPVIQALVIGLVVVFIYATIGVEYFSEDDPEGFKSFYRAVYSLFSVVAFQQWREEFLPPFGSVNSEEDMMHVGRIAFIYSYVAVVVWILLQVVVAVLLENFFTATAKDKEAMAIAKASEARGNLSALEPLMEVLMSEFQTLEDLTLRIRALFDALDVDSKECLTFEELSEGLKKMGFREKIHLSREDWESVTNGLMLCNEQTEVTPIGFDAMLKGQLALFVQRRIANALAMNTGTTEVQALLSAAKYLLLSAEPPPHSMSKRRGSQLAAARAGSSETAARAGSSETVARAGSSETAAREGSPVATFDTDPVMRHEITELRSGMQDLKQDMWEIKEIVKGLAKASARESKQARRIHVPGAEGAKQEPETVLQSHFPNYQNVTTKLNGNGPGKSSGRVEEGNLVFVNSAHKGALNGWSLTPHPSNGGDECGFNRI